MYYKHFLDLIDLSSLAQGFFGSLMLLEKDEH